MAQAVVHRAAGDERLTPQVRNALLALIVGGIAAILDSTMVTLALHTLVVRLHSSDGTIQWVTTGYLLAMAVAIPVTGWAESRWGGKRVWMAALVLFVRRVGPVRAVLERRQPDRLPGPAGLRRRADLPADADPRL